MRLSECLQLAVLHILYTYLHRKNWQKDWSLPKTAESLTRQPWLSPEGLRSSLPLSWALGRRKLMFPNFYSQPICWPSLSTTFVCCLNHSTPIARIHSISQQPANTTNEEIYMQFSFKTPQKSKADLELVNSIRRHSWWRARTKSYVLWISDCFIK